MNVPDTTFSTVLHPSCGYEPKMKNEGIIKVITNNPEVDICIYGILWQYLQWLPSHFTQNPL